MAILDTLARPHDPPDEPHRFTWAEVVRMGEVFGEARVELIRGEIFVMPEEGFLHVDDVRVLQRWLLGALAGTGFELCVREPLHVSADTVLVPDLCVVPEGTTARDMLAARAALVIEVGDSTARRDRVLKLPIYAAAGVRELWLVDARARAITAYRAPIEDAYSDVRRYAAGEPVAPLCAPEATFDPDALPREA